MDYLTDGDFPKQIQQRLIKGCYSCIGKGWLDLVLDLDIQLTELHPNYEITQIKEKLGGLRLYTNGVTSKAGHELIADFEEKSYGVCESCGQPGRLRGTNWLIVRCDKCHTNLNKQP